MWTLYVTRGRTIRIESFSDRDAADRAYYAAVADPAVDRATLLPPKVK